MRQKDGMVTDTPVDTEVWQDLANAIVIQAVKDYRTARKVRRKKPDDERARKMMLDTMRFFGSKWFGILTKADPVYLVEQLMKEEDK